MTSRPPRFRLAVRHSRSVNSVKQPAQTGNAAGEKTEVPCHYLGPVSPGDAEIAFRLDALPVRRYVSVIRPGCSQQTAKFKPDQIRGGARPPTNAATDARQKPATPPVMPYVRQERSPDTDPAFRILRRYTPNERPLLNIWRFRPSRSRRC